LNRLLEIGLLHPFDTTAAIKRAPSLQMWRGYFPNAKLVGFDINDFSRVAMNGCIIYRGDMGERGDLVAMAKAAGPFDIIIDDGSHASHHQQIALATLFPHLRSGGTYFIEDLHWVPPELELPDAPRTRTILQQSRFDGAIYTPVMSANERDYLRESIMSVELFDSHDRLNYDKRDALAAIRKR
jgi:hypothetical protein